MRQGLTAIHILSHGSASCRSETMFGNGLPASLGQPIAVERVAAIPELTPPGAPDAKDFPRRLPANLPMGLKLSLGKLQAGPGNK
jgi:hypothetical protein